MLDKPDKQMMKAVVCTQYGPPEVLSITDIAKPVPKNNELLIRVMAASVNSGDVRVRGLSVEGFMKLVMRLVLGWKKPRKPVLGTVFAGVVEQTGKAVTRFNTGDAVVGLTGFQFGAHAAYTTIKETGNVVLKPQNASFAEAAAMPFGAQTAIYFLEKAGIKKCVNPQVLIIGATGSVGTAAIQIARSHHADITAVCSSAGIELVNKLGVTNTIAYDKEDFTKQSTQFDIIFDASGKYKKRQCAHLLKAQGGVYKTVGGLEYAHETKEQLLFLKELYGRGAYQAVIDKVFTIDEAIEAHHYVESGKKKGNVVLSLSGENDCNK
ncbi:MAG: NAD(P)-dependent alcohol dehydrogenase [Niastella sp.]|nr:NAD(P)-dependent alcohol dehydrogenase [Niastella sp.]